MADPPGINPETGMRYSPQDDPMRRADPVAADAQRPQVNEPRPQFPTGTMCMECGMQIDRPVWGPFPHRDGCAYNMRPAMDAEARSLSDPKGTANANSEPSPAIDRDALYRLLAVEFEGAFWGNDAATAREVARVVTDRIMARQSQPALSPEAVAQLPSEPPDRCDRIVNNGMGEPTECGRKLPCDLHSPPAESREAEALDFDALRVAVEHAFEVAREWQPHPTHSALNMPVWPFDKFTEAVAAKYLQAASTSSAGADEAPNGSA